MKTSLALRIAAVPVPPRDQIDRLIPGAPRQPFVLTVRALARSEDPLIRRGGRGAESDHHLLSGAWDRATHILEEAPRRLAVIAFIRSQHEQTPHDPAALLALCDAPDPEDRAIARVFSALALPDANAEERIRTGLDTLRRVGGPTAVARLALAAALAHAAAGRLQSALSEALRAQAQGELADRQLFRVARRLVAHLWGSTQDARVAELIAVTTSLHARDTEQLFQRIAQATLTLVRDAQRAFVLVGPHDDLVVRGAAFDAGFSGSPSLAIAASTVVEGREVITREVQEVATSASIEAMDLRTVLCIPLSDQERCLGVIYADSKTATDQELQEVAWMVRAFAAYAAVVLQNTTLLDRANQRSLHAREVAHDLRNVASGMRLALDEFNDFELPPEIQVTVADLQTMNRVLLQSLAALVDDRREPRQRIQFDALVHSSTNLMRFQARAQGVRIQLQTQPVTIEAVSDELARVVANLVGNALKYSESGQTIRIEVGERDGRAYLIVADQGPGIPEEELSSIFESGTQARGARPGHGLGLGICRSIIRSHGGKLRARNRSGSGAAFTVVLPHA